MTGLSFEGPVMTGITGTVAETGELGFLNQPDPPLYQRLRLLKFWAMTYLARHYILQLTI